MAQDYVAQGEPELGSNKIARSPTAYALYNNPRAIAERGLNAPIVQPAESLMITTAGAGTWDWPDGVTAAVFYLQAAGGAGAGSTALANGNPGENTTVTYNSVTHTALGGDGGQPNETGEGGFGGTNLDWSIPGKSSNSSNGSDSFFGLGGYTYSGGSFTPIRGGGGYGNSNQGGCGGEMGCIRIVRVAGLDTVSFNIGAGGTTTSWYGNQAGANGCLLIKW